MWVLAERENAEEVGYPVVWEEIKPAENEVPYNIREEQTIDKSSVFTANNDTTTWMANVIPWVNAPKLIASTSIYWDLWGWWEEVKFWAKLSATINMANYWGNNDKTFKTWSISEAWGDAAITQWTNWMKIPASWWYQFDVTFPAGYSEWKDDTYILSINEWQLYYDAWAYNTTIHTATFRVKLEEWDEIYTRTIYTYIGTADYSSWSKPMTMIITKL